MSLVISSFGLKVSVYLQLVLCEWLPWFRNHIQNIKYVNLHSIKVNITSSFHVRNLMGSTFQL